MKHSQSSVPDVGSFIATMLSCSTSKSSLAPVGRLALLLAPFLFLGCTQPQSSRASIEKISVQQVENIPVSKADKVNAFTEPYFVASPTNPAHLLASAIRGTYQEAEWSSTCTSFVSFDAGRSWTEHHFNIKQCSDPWVLLKGNGTALFSALGLKGVEIYRSEDGGRSWPDKPTAVLPGLDHPSITTDHSRGAGVIYVVGERGRDETRTGPFIAKSLDDGKTFQAVNLFLPNHFHNSVSPPVFLNDGTMALSFSSYAQSSGSFSQPKYLTPRRDWIALSKDGGKSFASLRSITEACASQSGFASLEIDQTNGNFSNRLYYVCSELKTNQVIVHYSSDRGASWRGSVVVPGSNQDVVFRRTPSIAVNTKGIVGVTWYERRQLKDGKCSQDVNFAGSIDGGQTFQPPRQVSTSSLCPETTANAQAATRFPAGGDYSGLTATNDGLFHVLWADSRTGIYGLYTAAVK